MRLIKKLIKKSMSKNYLKEIERELSSFNEYHRIILFLIKLISVLKNKLFIIKNVFSTKETILFKVIMQKTTFNCTRDNDEHNHSSLKSNKFFEH